MGGASPSMGWTLERVSAGLRWIPGMPSGRLQFSWEPQCFFSPFEHSACPPLFNAWEGLDYYSPWQRYLHGPRGSKLLKRVHSACSTSGDPPIVPTGQNSPRRSHRYQMSHLLLLSGSYVQLESGTLRSISILKLRYLHSLDLLISSHGSWCLFGKCDRFEPHLACSVARDP